MKNITSNSLLSKINPLKSYSMSPTLIIVYILMLAIVGSINPIFIHLKNFQAIATGAPLIGIVAVGLGIVILTGNVDLSVGSIAGFTGIIVAELLFLTHIPTIIDVIIGILAGIAIGAINGFVVTYIGVNSVVTTLGMWFSLSGLSFVVAGKAVNFHNPALQKIGQGYIFKVIPNIFFIMILVLVIMYVVLRFTQFGRNIYLVGSNNSSARVVGVNVKKVQFLAFLFSGGLAAFAGILLVSQVSFGSSLFGIGWEFQALTICVVGGISLSGGRGTFVGLFLAWIILGSLQNALTMANIGVNWRDFFEGSLLILAIVVDSISARTRGLNKS